MHNVRVYCVYLHERVRVLQSLLTVSVTMLCDFIHSSVITVAVI